MSLRTASSCVARGSGKVPLSHLAPLRGVGVLEFRLPGEQAHGTYSRYACFARALRGPEWLLAPAFSAVLMEFYLCCPQHCYGGTQGYC